MLLVIALRGGPLAINFEPTWIDEDFPLGLERLAGYPGDARGDFKARRWKEDSNETPHNHRVHSSFGI